MGHEKGAKSLQAFSNEKSQHKMYKAGTLWVAALIGVGICVGGSQIQSVAASTSHIHSVVTNATGTTPTNQATVLKQQETGVNAQIIAGHQTGQYSTKGVTDAGDDTTSAVPDTDVYQNRSLPITGNAVVVRCVDIEGNMLAPDKVITGKVGDPYTMTAPAFDYYENPQLATDSAPANGTFTNDVQTVTFVYTKTPIPRGSVNVKFVDVDGKRLASDKILTGQAGDPYEARPIDMTNYQFARLATGSAPEDGSFTDGTQTVTFIYTKNPVAQGTVDVKYVDDNGKQIAPDKILTGHVGDPYAVTPTMIANYHYLRLASGSIAENGAFATGSLTVTFVYAKQATPVNPSTPVTPSTPTTPSTQVLPSMSDTPTESAPLSDNDTAPIEVIIPTKQISRYLPNTGDNQRTSLIAIGVALLLALISFGSFGLRRREK